MDKLIAIFTIFIFLVPLSGCEAANHTQTKNGWDLVNHKDFNFSIKYPNHLLMFIGNEFGYKGDEYVRFIVGTYSWQIPKSLIIKVETRATENPTLNDVIDWGNEGLDAIRSDPARVINSGFEDIFLVEEQIGTTPVYRRRYAYRQSGYLYEEVYIAREKDMVIITLSVDEEYFDEYVIIFDQMVDSFKPLN